MKHPNSSLASKWFAVWLHIAIAATAHAQTSSSAGTPSGYCGSGVTEKVVPDQVFDCDIAGACEMHDVCYGKCDPGGSKEGSDYCKQSEFSPERVAAKRACDRQFYQDITKANGNKWQCKAIAGIYTAAVAIAGQGPFNGKPMSPQAMRDLVETSATPEEAVIKFNALATEAKAGKLDLSQLKRQGNAIILPAVQAGANPGGMTLQLKQGASSADIEKAMEAWKNRQAFKPLILNKANSMPGETR